MKFRLRRPPAHVIVLGVACLAMTPPQAATPFIPFEPRAYALVNSITFSPDDQTLYGALFHRNVLAHRGRPDTTAGLIAIYSARRMGDGWSEPEILPFTGAHEDYEPTMSPDGTVLVFNSKRPHPDGRVSTRNDLWIVDRTTSGWGTPRRLSVINSFELEESYATIDSARRMIYVRGPVREGGDDFDLYETRMAGDGSVGEPTRLPFAGTRYGEGDPQLARDGSYLIFTRWDHTVGWQQTCDLWIAFRTPTGWTEPVALTELNTARPDYAAALSSDGRWLYYRNGGSLLRAPADPIIAAARQRSSFQVP